MRNTALESAIFPEVQHFFRDASHNSSSRSTGLQNLSLHYTLTFKGTKHKSPENIQHHTCSQILLLIVFKNK